ncbi:Glucose-6-phosphate 1-dehydrogenase [Coemansia sp. RSA 454]|nr:Glucose-6-phosphate 1-dehydrogenase [Coemansia sp. RSA 454]
MSFTGGLDEAAKHDVLTTIVVFGASGDLAKKKTFPALFHLYQQGLLPKRTRIIGYARTQMDRTQFASRVTSFFKENVESPDVQGFLSVCAYVSGKYDVDEDFQRLRSEIDTNEQEMGRRADGQEERVHIYYLALPPSVFVSVSEQIKHNVYDASCTNRVVIEKPFGHDLESSRALSTSIGALFEEDEVYRIDHYLGKEMVKNILAVRFAKNHLLQVLSVVAMHQPKSLKSEDIRDRKTEVLRRILPIQLEDTLLGQYVGTRDGTKPGYKDDDTVPQDSITPTFAQCVLHVDNERWRGVPWVMKAGKALDEAKMTIRIQFKDMPNAVFPNLARNELVLQVSPKESVYIKTIVKEPGLSTKLAMSELDLTYHKRYQDIKIPDAYATLILDVLNGDHSNFVRSDELDEAWRIFTPLLHQIDSDQVVPLPYEYGSRGPKGVDEFATERAGYKLSSREYHWQPRPTSASGKL